MTFLSEDPTYLVGALVLIQRSLLDDAQGHAAG